MKKIFSFVMVLFLAFALVGCKGGNELTGLTIKNSKTQLQINKTLQLEVVGTPADAELGTITWSVNKPELATVSQTGLLTAGGTAGIVKVTATAENGVFASKSIRITVEEVAQYPDLGGYTITIAQAEIALGEINPFLEEDTKDKYGYYAGLDRDARRDAWSSVEDDFNCTIDVVKYPDDAAWGPARWNYIIERARNGQPEFDFYVVPDAQIPGFVTAKAIKDLTEWYDADGHNLMNTLNRTAGSYKNKLYSINTSEPALYNIIGYNYNLWDEIHKYDPTIEEPAKMFNDGNWTYSSFVEYALKVQAALDSLYTGEDDKHYALSGWPTYYWVGMVDRNGVGIADVTATKMHLTGEDETAAGEALQEIFAGGAFDPAFSVDGGVTSFNNGKALFNTGDVWFIGSLQDRWSEEIDYGYVPFPAPDGSDPTNYSVGLTAEACWVMAEGRNYKAYGDECTAENIYKAIMEYWRRAKANYQGSDTYDPENQIRATASAKFGASQESMKAFVTMSNGLSQYAFYEPLASASNSIVSTYSSDLTTAIHNFVKGTGAATWNDAVGSFQSSLDKAIVDAFG